MRTPRLGSTRQRSTSNAVAKPALGAQSTGIGEVLRQSSRSNNGARTSALCSRSVNGSDIASLGDVKRRRLEPRSVERATRGSSAKRLFA
jgi:hypothetical protein